MGIQNISGTRGLSLFTIWYYHGIEHFTLLWSVLCDFSMSKKIQYKFASQMWILWSKDCVYNLWAFPNVLWTSRERENVPTAFWLVCCSVPSMLKTLSVKPSNQIDMQSQCVCIVRSYLVLNMEKKNFPKMLSRWRRGFFDEYHKIR